LHEVGKAAFQRATREQLEVFVTKLISRSAQNYC